MTGATRIDHGRDTGADSEDVRIDPEGAEAFHEMQVNVDQARCYDQSAGIDDGSAVGVQIRSDRSYDSVVNVDVERAVPAACRVDEAATFENVVVKLLSHLFLYFQFT